MNASWTIYSQSQPFSVTDLSVIERPVRFDRHIHSISAKGKQIKLRLKLWGLINLLFENANQLVTRDQIIEKIWHSNQYTGQRGLTHSICEIRRILRELDVDYEIITVPKTGYILKI